MELTLAEKAVIRKALEFYARLGALPSTKEDVLALADKFSNPNCIERNVMLRERISVDDVAADPTNAYEVSAHGDVAIEKLIIHGEGKGRWVYVKYTNGGSSTGVPAHWASYVRITPDN